RAAWPRIAFCPTWKRSTPYIQTLSLRVYQPFRRMSEGSGAFVILSPLPPANGRRQCAPLALPRGFGQKLVVGEVYAAERRYADLRPEREAVEFAGLSGQLIGVI